jgi:hypothetical protein
VKIESTKFVLNLSDKSFVSKFCGVDVRHDIGKGFVNASN